MAQAHSSTPDVLVVGAGPTGLLLAGELLRHGVACRLIDKLTAPQPHAKASGVMPRSLEMFEDVGVLDAFLARGMPVRRFSLYGQNAEPMLQLDLGELDCPYPMMLGIEQFSTERILTEHLHELGGAIERGVEMTSFSQDMNVVQAILRHPDGREEVVRSRYLVGCDGAHSSVRHGLGLTFEGAPYEADFLLAHGRIDWPVPRNESRVFMHRTGSVFCFPLPEETWIIVAELVGEQTARHHEGDPTVEDWQRILDERTQGEARMLDAKWTAFFRVNHRQVNRYQEGRVFVAGDAAHIHSPAGGQGMNTGMQDAYNLAWKLAAVLHHGAAESLLESYDAERRPVGRAMLRFTDSAQHAMLIRNVALQEARNALMGLAGHLEVVTHHVAMQIGETLYTYHDGPLAGEHHDSGLHLHTDARHPGFRDTRHFQHGPRGGDLAPDAQLNGSRLHEHLRGTQAVALIFQGTHGTQAGETDLVTVASTLERTCGAWLRTAIVTPHAETPPSLAGAPAVLADPDQHAHERYGARGQCLYLVRPDGYVAWRSLPIDLGRLNAFLARSGLPSGAD